MKNVSSIEFMRRRFDEALAYYKSKGLAPQRSQIRIEEDLVSGNGLYEFNLRKERLSGVERNLRRNDLFIVRGLSILLRIEDEDRPNVLPLFTYAKKGVETVTAATASDPAVYTVDQAGFETDDIEALYNGSLSIITQSTVNFQYLPCSLFKYESPAIVGTQDGSAKAVNNGFNLESNILTMAEQLVLAGTQDHKVTLTFPSFNGANYEALQGGNGTSTADDTKIPNTHFKSKVVFFADGYLIAGGTDEKYRQDSANPFAPAM